jgi:hypothetical protein
MRPLPRLRKPCGMLTLAPLNQKTRINVPYRSLFWSAPVDPPFVMRGVYGKSLRTFAIRMHSTRNREFASNWISLPSGLQRGTRSLFEAVGRRVALASGSHATDRVGLQACSVTFEAHRHRSAHDWVVSTNGDRLGRRL